MRGVRSEFDQGLNVSGITCHMVLATSLCILSGLGKISRKPFYLATEPMGFLWFSWEFPNKTDPFCWLLNTSPFLQRPCRPCEAPHVMVERYKLPKAPMGPMSFRPNMAVLIFYGKGLNAAFTYMVLLNIYNYIYTQYIYYIYIYTIYIYILYIYYIYTLYTYNIYNIYIYIHTCFRVFNGFLLGCSDSSWGCRLLGFLGFDVYIRDK
jgi:hypothetical protein